MIPQTKLISTEMAVRVEARLLLIYFLLQTYSDIDELWAIEAEKRVAAIEDGETDTIAGDVVFRKFFEKEKVAQ